MTERAIVCPGCGEAVPYGRLSCPECGTLLASVAGGVRPTVRTADAPGPDAANASRGTAVEEPAIDPVADEPAPEPARLRAARKSASAAVAGAYVPPGATPPPDPPLGPVTSGRVGAGALPPPRTTAGKGGTQAKAATSAAPPPVAASPTLVAATATTEAPADEPAVAAAPASSPDPGPESEPSPGPTETPDDAEAPAPVPFPPATLVAARPSPVVAASVAAVPTMSGPAAPATSGSASAAAAATGPAAASSAAGASDELAWLDPGLDWATVAGAGLIVVGMLLPWSRTVIGATGVGYFDTWGLAGPLHVLVFLWALAVVGLSIVRKPAPAWVRSGLAGFALGAFSLGLTWPYLFGPLGARIGVLAVAVGSFVLIATGVLAVWRARHADAEPPV